MLEDLCEPALSIRIKSSEDGEWSDLHSSHDKQKGVFRIKCFRCYGSNDRHCNECRGTERVASSHPLAVLLNEVLLKKLDMRREEGVYAIRQEEEQFDERRLANYSDKSQGYNICISKVLEQSPDKIPSSSNIKAHRKCHSCSSLIENCYTVCKTCQQNNIPFWICDFCSDNKRYHHPLEHSLEPTFDCTDKMETVSQQYDGQEDHEDQFQSEGIHQEFSLATPDIMLDKKNSSIANYLEDQNILMCSNSSDIAKIEVASRVKFDIEQGLFSSFEFKSTIHNPSNDQIPVVVAKKSRSNKENMVAQKTSIFSQQINEEYAFLDYKCDYCEIQPIINVRYHCTFCEDYDLCQKCYEQCQTFHEHDHFEKVDGRLFRQKAMEKLFQNKDINLKSTCAGPLNLNKRKVKRTKTLHFPSQYIREQ